MAKNKKKEMKEIEIDGVKYSVQLPIADFIQKLHVEKNQLGALVADWVKIQDAMQSVGKKLGEYFEEMSKANETSGNSTKSDA